MWLQRAFGALLTSAALFQHVAAQTEFLTDCFPMNKTCPPKPALSMDIGFNFNATPKASVWETTVGPVTYDANNGATFTIAKQGQSPTIRSKFYFFWGRAEIWMKACPGTGIISSIMFLSDNLDEIDWEFFGSNNTVVQSNYFGKNRPDHHNAGYHPVNGGVQGGYHNYTIVWTEDALDFYVDTAKVRTLLPKDANNTQNYPQTPMRIFIGNWAAGAPDQPKGQREWAGGDTDFSKAPFSMFVKSVAVQDYSTGKEYEYTDRTGSKQSIKIHSGNSTVKEAIEAKPEPPAPSIAEKWEALSPTAKIAIYASAAGVGAAILAFALFYCIRQRRRGAREAKLAEAKADQERMELERFRKAGVDPDSFVDQATEYNAKDMRSGGNSDQTSYSVPESPAVTGNEKWEKAAAFGAGAGVLGAAAAASAGGPRSPMPLLREGAQSPRVTSPASPNNPFNAPYSDRPANTRSPAPTIPNVLPHQGSRSPPLINMQSPSAAGYQQPGARSFSSPDTQMRHGSPGPQQPGFGGVGRMASPSPVSPQPQRSFTSTSGFGGGYGSPQNTGYGAPQNPGFGAPQNQGYGNGNGNNGNGGNQYWGSNNYR